MFSVSKALLATQWTIFCISCPRRKQKRTLAHKHFSAFEGEKENILHQALRKYSLFSPRMNEGERRNREWFLKDIKFSWDLGYRCTHTSPLIKGKTQLINKILENSVFLELDFEETLFHICRLKLLKFTWSRSHETNSLDCRNSKQDNAFGRKYFEGKQIENKQVRNPNTIKVVFILFSSLLLRKKHFCFQEIGTPWLFNHQQEQLKEY